MSCGAWKKENCCRYDPSLSFESAQGGLRIYLPAEEGYINYNLVHSVHEGKNCDVWRLGKAFWVDDAFQNELELTRSGAEWDMALRLMGRADFIGGYAHGDERFTAFSVNRDGKEIAVEELSELVPFQTLRIAVDSVGLDPADSQTLALKHRKEYTVEREGITLFQRVEWQNDYPLGSSYMAMMPPLKSITDLFYTDVDSSPREAATHYGSVLGAKSAVVYGSESHFRFFMAVPRYESLLGGDRFLLTDNNGSPYHKMYFVIANGAQVAKGDVWETETRYEITKGRERALPQG